MNFSRLALFFALAFGLVRADNTTQITVCRELALQLPDRVFFPDAPIYNASISSYPFIQLRLHPNCIVRPTSAQDVSVTLGVLNESNSTRFAVKGGGHNANAGFNNIDNGVTIDMQSMKAVEVSRDDQVVRVEAGALSQDAYNAAEKRNLTVLAGRIGVVGTAGFLTGGIRFFRTYLSMGALTGARRCLILLASVWLGVRLNLELRNCPCKRGYCER